MIYYWVLTAAAGFAMTVLGFFMLGWQELKGAVAGGPYVVFGLLTFPLAHHLSPVSVDWSRLAYLVGAFSLAFGLAVMAQEHRVRGWFVFRYFVLGVFWLALAVVTPEVTSSMRMFPLLVGAAYISIALATLNTGRLTGGYVGFDVALNGICFLFLGILLAAVPDFFTNPGPSIWTP